MSIATTAQMGGDVFRPDPRELAGPAGRTRAVARLCLVCAALLIPWAGYLSTSLPAAYVTTNWNLAWVGFDIALTALLAATGILAHRGHVLHAPVAFATAAFLVADTWFDIMTSAGADLALSLASATLVELPLAGLLVGSATLALTGSATSRWHRHRPTQSSSFLGRAVR